MTGATLKELRKEAWAGAKVKYKENLPNIFLFVLIAVACCALSVALTYFVGTVGLLVIPFLFVPFVFALQSSYKQGTGLSLNGTPTILGGFGSYFSGRNFGSYRLIRNFLWSYLISLAASYVSAAVASLVMSNDPAFAETINELILSLQNGSFDDVNVILSTSPFTDMVYVVSIVQMAALIFSSVYFFYRALPIPYVDVPNVDAPAQVKSSVFRGGKRMPGSRFEKNYWGLMWPAFVLSAGFFALGSYLATIFFPVGADMDACLANGQIVPILGLFLMAIVMAFLSPYFLECLLLIERESSDQNSAFAKRLLKQNLEYLRFTQQMHSQQASELEDAIKKMQDEEDGIVDVEATEKEPDEGPTNLDDYGRGDSH